MTTNWYLTRYEYGDWVNDTDSDEDWSELRAEFHRGVREADIDGKNLHEELDKVEANIMSLMWTLDHVTSEQTMSGDYDKDVAFLQGVRHAIKTRLKGDKP